MEYEKIREPILAFDFIKDEENADAAIKAVFGVFASRLNEDEAKKLTDGLPEPLTFENLRGHQVRDLKISAEEYIENIGAQLKLNTEQAVCLINTVFSAVKDQGGKTLEDVARTLPQDWRDLIEKGNAPSGSKGQAMLKNLDYDLIETISIISKSLHRYDTYVRDASECGRCQELWTDFKESREKELGRLLKEMRDHMDRGSVSVR